MKHTTVLPRFWPALMSLTVALITILPGCSTNEKQDAEVRLEMDRLQATYAPDKRIAVFDIGWERGPHGLVAKGEVDQQEAKSKVLEVLRRLTGLEVLDSVRVLPDTGLSGRPYGIITVSVGNVRARPRHSAEMVTQVLMGMVVKLISKHGGWYFVQSYDRYLGWIEEESMEIVSGEDLEQWRSSQRLIVTGTVGFVSEKPESGAPPVSDVVVGCLVKELGSAGRWFRVGLPDGRSGFIEASIVQNFDTWKRQRKLTPERVEKSAIAFMGVPYLWGGTSAKGFDCSGFTKTVYRMNGLELNRDANQQALQGDDVVGSKDWTNLRKGDLLFFGREATDSLAERIGHVGIYLGKGEYIHCSGHVQRNSLDPSAPNYNRYNHERFVRARRVIGARAVPEVL